MPAGTITTPSGHRVCSAEGCDSPVIGRRPDALYCSKSCQQHAARAARRRRRRESLRCHHCDRKLTPGHSGARYCDAGCREKARQARDRYALQRKNLAVQLRRRYGISLEQYEAMLELQDGRCAICGRHGDEFGRRLAVDHCHETGKVRGLLCINCNPGIGAFRDNPELLRRAASYLEDQS